MQFTLKAVYDEHVLVREVAAADPEIARLSAATRGRPDEEVHREKVRLGELVASGVERRKAADEQAVLERLDQVAERIIAESPQHERLAVHAQLLVQRRAPPRVRGRGGAPGRRAGWPHDVPARGPARAVVVLRRGARGAGGVMGLITGILTLPLAPVRGVAALGEVIAEEAERKLAAENDPARALAELDVARASGEIGEEEAAELEAQLIEELLAARGPRSEG